MAYRLLRTLEDHRLVQRQAGDVFTIGYGVVTLSRRAASDLATAATVELQALAEEVDLAAFIMVRDGDDAVTTVVAEPSTPGTWFTPVSYTHLDVYKRQAPSQCTGTSGAQIPGAGIGVSPFGGRPGKGRVGSGEVSGESTYQNASARRPESTWARALGSVRAACRMPRRSRHAASSGGTRKFIVALVTARFSAAAAARST